MTVSGEGFVRNRGAVKKRVSAGIPGVGLADGVFQTLDAVVGVRRVLVGASRRFSAEVGIVVAVVVVTQEIRRDTDSRG